METRPDRDEGEATGETPRAELEAIRERIEAIAHARAAVSAQGEAPEDAHG